MVTKIIVKLIPQSIYSFVDEKGVNTHIDVEALRKWCLLAKPKIWDVPIKVDVAHKFLEENSVDLKRCNELLSRTLLMKNPHFDPIIMAKDGSYTNGAPDVMLVDGHHRFYIAAIMRKQPFIPGHILEVEQWKPFQIKNLPDITAEELIARPVTKRNY